VIKEGGGKNGGLEHGGGGGGGKVEEWVSTLEVVPPEDSKLIMVSALFPITRSVWPFRCMIGYYKRQSRSSPVSLPPPFHPSLRLFSHP